MRKFILVLLLFCTFFSSLHAYVYAYEEPRDCTIKEHILELQIQVHHGDLCDLHAEYHHPILLDISLLTIEDITFNTTPIYEQINYHYTSKTTLLKPPINL